jgi:hypothetical protein
MKDPDLTVKAKKNGKEYDIIMTYKPFLTNEDVAIMLFKIMQGLVKEGEGWKIESVRQNTSE